MADAAAGRWSWVEQWMSSEGLELEGDAPVEGGAAACVDFMVREAVEGFVERGREHGHNVRLRTKTCDSMPVFTVAWSVDGVACKVQTFLDFAFARAIELAPRWDDTFLSAEKLLAGAPPAQEPTPESRHAAGKSAESTEDKFAPGSVVQLWRWRFRARPLGDREMLYLTIPAQLPASGANTAGGVVVCYLSVRSARFPVGQGFTRALNLTPSFDCAAAEAGGTLALQHCMTTGIGGWVGDCAWNTLFKSAVLGANVREALSVKGLLEALEAERAGDGGSATEVVEHDGGDE